MNSHYAVQYSVDSGFHDILRTYEKGEGGFLCAEVIFIKCVIIQILNEAENRR